MRRMRSEEGGGHQDKVIGKTRVLWGVGDGDV